MPLTKEQLSNSDFYINPGDRTIHLFDYDGITYGDDEDDQRQIYALMEEYFGGLLGYPIKIVKEVSAGNGHETWEYNVVQS